jgi:hypothetical protein
VIDGNYHVKRRLGKADQITTDAMINDLLLCHLHHLGAHFIVTRTTRDGDNSLSRLLEISVDKVLRDDRLPP